MLQLTVVAVGKQKEVWQREGTREYLKRLEAYCRPTLVEVEEYRLPDQPSPAQIQKGLEEEGRTILERVGKTPYVALCIQGKQLSSEQLSLFLKAQQQVTGSLALVIGGSHGLAPQVEQKAILQLSVSRMTFPHQLFRVLLVEQLYRAFSIAAGGKYHK